MNNTIRVIKYIARRLLIVGIIVAVGFSAFFTALKSSSLYFMLNDSLKKRIDVILLDEQFGSSSCFFSEEYLNSDDYQALKDQYLIYDISNYGFKHELGNLFVWPWQTHKTIVVKEAVFSINGSLDTNKISKAEALASGVAAIPEWKNTVYRIKLVYKDDSWVINSMEDIGDFNYKPVLMQSLSPSELAALRTPSPIPTAEPSPTAPGSTPAPLNNRATVSTAIIGTTVNVRSGPATGYNIVAELKGGDKITVIGESDNWYKVKLDSGTEGYVSKVYVTLD